MINLRDAEFVHIQDMTLSLIAVSGFIYMAVAVLQAYFEES